MSLLDLLLQLLISPTHASFATGLNDAITLGKSLSLSGLTFADLFTNIGTFLTGLVAALALIAIVWGGVMYILSLGDESRSARAKQIILYAILGLLIAGIASIIIDIVQCIYTQTEGCQPTRIINIILNAANVLLAPAGVIAFAALIYGGYLYMTSGGDESRASRAKNTIVYALLGLAVIGIAGIVVNVVIGLLP